jgi:hypothetical protein
MTDLPQNMGEGGETLPPTPSFKDDLDRLFATMLFEYLGETAKELPDHIAAALLTGEDHGIDVLVLGNWKTRQKIEIARAGLDSPNAEFMSKSFDNDEPGVEYKITITTLMGTVIPLEFADGTVATTMAKRYEVFDDKVKFWAESTNDEGEEVVYTTEAKKGTEDFDDFREYLLDVAGFRDLVGDFDFTPESITGTGDN